jgi:site-specific DNA-adenine methylase
VGAGSVFLNTDFSRYILADINSDLISLYNIVKLRTDEYVAEARKLFTPENNNRTFTTSSALSLIRARIRSAARCCSSISTVMVTTACAV